MQQDSLAVGSMGRDGNTAAQQVPAAWRACCRDWLLGCVYGKAQNGWLCLFAAASRWLFLYIAAACAQ
jgi:hypothetical protein